jgi:hypothetical protein
MEVMPSREGALDDIDIEKQLNNAVKMRSL